MITRRLFDNLGKISEYFTKILPMIKTIIFHNENITHSTQHPSSLYFIKKILYIYKNWTLICSRTYDKILKKTKNDKKNNKTSIKSKKSVSDPSSLYFIKNNLYIYKNLLQFFTWWKRAKESESNDYNRIRGSCMYDMVGKKKG